MNRQQRRIEEKEMRKIHYHTAWIFQGFEKMLFGEAPYSYRGLYNYFNEIWQIVAKWYNANRAKNLKIDPYWFHNQYKPLEASR